MYGDNLKIDQLKVGDRVGISSGNNYSKYSFGRVTRILKSQIAVELEAETPATGNIAAVRMMKFTIGNQYNSGGREVGGSQWHMRYLVSEQYAKDANFNTDKERAQKRTLYRLDRAFKQYQCGSQDLAVANELLEILGRCGYTGEEKPKGE